MATLKSLHNQTILITGASSGIGLCTALLAAERGSNVVLIARSGDVLDLIAQQINENKFQALAFAADVSDRYQLEQAARAAIGKFGRIDTWINNAGVSIYGSLEAVADRDNRRLFDVNFWGVVNGSLIALPYLKAAGGALINVGSEVSDAVVPLQGMYAASKHAVKGFTDALRVEVNNVQDSNVSITLIQPTAVNTPYPEHAKNYMDREPKLPEPMIDPQKVAEAILHAATSGGRDVTVGAMSVMNTAMSKLIPSLADKMAATYVDRQQKHIAPRNPDGTLYTPGHAGRIYGSVV